MSKMLMKAQINAPAREALTAVAQLVETVRDPTADLVKARLTPMLTYRGRLSSNYLLQLNTLDEELTGGSVDVQFDDGLLLRCPYMFSTVARCDNLGERLSAAMKDLASVGYLTCVDCRVQVEQEVRDWLGINLSTLGNAQAVKIAQYHGGWIYLRASFDSGRQLECRFSGDHPISVDLCLEAK